MLYKILVLPLVASLAFFAVDYSNDTEKVLKNEPIVKQIEQLPDEEHELSSEIVEVYNTNYNEMNISETNVTESKAFSVEIVGELNTTKETVITLSAKVSNAKNIDACNYFWYEENELLSVGAVLQEGFTKGEHELNLRVLDGSTGEEINATVYVNAFNYYETRIQYLNAYYGELEYEDREILNHKGNYLLRDDGYFMKHTYVYDEESRVIEEGSYYYEYPSENKKMVYVYDSMGNRVSESTYGENGELLYLVVFEYDKEGNILKTLSGKDENSLVERSYEDYSYYGNETYSSPYVEKEGRKELNDNGDVTYEEVHHGDMKIVYEYEYDEKFNMLKDSSTMTSPRRFSESNSYYNKEGYVEHYDRKYGDSSGVLCAYNTNYTYDKNGRRKSTENQLLEGECFYLDEIKRIYSYDKDGAVKNIESSIDGEKGYSTMKVIKTYINSYEI